VGASLAVVALAGLGGGTAYAATLDTNAILGTTTSAPTIVAAGDNSFTIDVWADGNIPGNQPGVATVANRYFMAPDGTITASTAPADQTTLSFTAPYNYSQCGSNTPANVMGCASNPFHVAATLVVPAGTSGVTGRLTVADTGSNGLEADPTPDAGVVTVGAVNHPPTDPGAPWLDAGSTTPNKTGEFTIGWTPSTDPDAGDSVTYVLQQRDANDFDWSTVATGLSSAAYTFASEPEGSWTYRVQAVDNHGATSNWAADGSPIVVVDKSAPFAPLVTSPTSAAYTDGAGHQWYRDSVTVAFAPNGDPQLADTSPGSGVLSVSAPVTFDGSSVAVDGSFSTTGYATDVATNVSAGSTVAGYVDAQAPAVTATCPTSVLLHAPSATANWTASDPAPSSGLASAAGGSVPLDTSSVGTHTVTIPAGTASDNVGHQSAAVSCSYQVTYAWNGFLQPINDTAHFIGSTTSIFKAGSTVAVKFQLTDALGQVVQEAAPGPVWLAPVKGGALPSTATVDESSYTTTGTASGYYKWDPTTAQYIYNWNTAKAAAGSYWRIGVQLDDGTTHYVSIGLR
jgi:hypothetical protein